MSYFASVSLNGEWIHFQGDRDYMKIAKSELKEGAVFDKSEGKSLTFRIWVEKDKIYMLELFGHDLRWAHEVYEFPLINLLNETILRPTGRCYVHEHLARGLGIPPAPAK